LCPAATSAEIERPSWRIQVTFGISGSAHT
jgi:hypothetical protein